MHHLTIPRRTTCAHRNGDFNGTFPEIGEGALRRHPMKTKLLLGAASAILISSGGMTLAQMQGGNEGQNMNQQMQQMQQENPNMQRHKSDEQQATPEEGAKPDQDQNQQPTSKPEERHENMGSEERGRSTTQVKTLSTEQKTQLRRDVIMKRDAPRVENVNFTVRVGIGIPRTVRVVAVPEEIVAIYPEWNGFLYFVDGDEIVVVDPSTYFVVGVLEA